MEKIRSYNVGKSNYSKHSLQPWDAWKYIADPWRADVVKRLLRTKPASIWDRIFHPLTCDSRLNDYRKIKHILLKIQSLQNEGYIFSEKDTTYGQIDEVTGLYFQEYTLSRNEFRIFYRMFENPNKNCYIDSSIENINNAIIEEEQKPKYWWYRVCKTIKGKL